MRNINPYVTVPKFAVAPESAVLLTKREAAAELRMCEKSIENLVKRRELQVVQIGRAVRFEREEIRRFISSKRK